MTTGTVKWILVAIPEDCDGAAVNLVHDIKTMLREKYGHISEDWDVSSETNPSLIEFADSIANDPESPWAGDDDEDDEGEEKEGDSEPTDDTSDEDDEADDDTFALPG